MAGSEFPVLPSFSFGEKPLSSEKLNDLADALAALKTWVAAGDLLYGYDQNRLERLAKPADHGVLRMKSTGVPDYVTDVRYVGIQINEDVALVTGDRKGGLFVIPAELDGWEIVSVSGRRQAGTGTVTLQLRKEGGSDVLSTRLTMTSTAYSDNAVINASQKTVAEGDLYAIDVDGAGTNTFYCTVSIGLRAS